MIFRLLGWLAGMSTLDACATVYEVNTGKAVEMNPIIAGMFKAYGLSGVLAVKVGLVVLLAVCATHTPVSNRVIGVLIGAYVAVLGWHFVVLEGWA